MSPNDCGPTVFDKNEIVPMKILFQVRLSNLNEILPTKKVLIVISQNIILAQAVFDPNKIQLKYD